MLNSAVFEKGQTDILDKHEAFFAFSQKQFDDKAKEGVTYVAMYAGLIAPKGYADRLHLELQKHAKDHAAAVLEEYGVQRVIQYELANHEAHITMHIDDAVDALEVYGITRDQVREEFPAYMKYCVAHDLF